MLQKDSTKSIDSEEACPQFVRGTTPSFTYTLTDYAGKAIDLSQFAKIKVTLAQKGDRHSGKRITIDDPTASGNSISFLLSEEQTLTFDPGYISMQVYAKNSEDRSWATLAEDVTIAVRKSLKDGDTIE